MGFDPTPSRADPNRERVFHVDQATLDGSGARSSLLRLEYSLGPRGRLIDVSKAALSGAHVAIMHMPHNGKGRAFGRHGDGEMLKPLRGIEAECQGVRRAVVRPGGDEPDVEIVTLSISGAKPARPQIIKLSQRTESE